MKKVKNTKLTRKFRDRYRVENGRICVDLNLKSIKQIFDEKDPSPFRVRDLDIDATDYITSAVEEFSAKTPMKIVIFCETKHEETLISSSALVNAIHSFYAYEEELAKKELKGKLKQGQLAFLIGSTFLMFCLGLSEVLEALVFHAFAKKFFLEGLGIIGWVALWFPVNIFLYEWWPIASDRKIYNKIAKMPIEVNFPT